MDIDAYCREIEAHLCRRNAGHLVRISGPAFDLVRGWAQQGIPFNVAQQGIDRYIDRSNARGVRRRPARIPPGGTRPQSAGAEGIGGSSGLQASPCCTPKRMRPGRGVRRG